MGSDKFINTINEYYRADVIATDFSRKGVADVMNGWVSDKTEEMIPEMFTDEDISEHTVMVLINALAFNAKLEVEFDKYSTHEQMFTSADGSQANAEFMHSHEFEKYIIGENETGIVKNYKGGKYAFVALLPKEGVSIEDYIATLDSEKFLGLVGNAEWKFVNLALPKFSLDYSTGLVDTLAAMGTDRMFDPFNAELSGLGTSDYNLFVSKIIHKTHIDVDEAGTKAAAATAIVVDEATEIVPDVDIYNLVLDRPFVYAIIDNATGLPLFLGALTNLQ